MNSDSTNLNVSTPFVGRNAELTELVTYCRSAFEKNQGRVIFLVGEAGIGKTTLGDQFNQTMQSHYPDMRYAYAYCSEKTGGIAPYTPFIQLHQHLLDQEAIKNKKESWLLKYAQEIGPDFFDMVPVAGPALKFAFKSTTFALEKRHDKRASYEQVAFDQANIFQLFTNSLRYISHQNPLLLFIDDWHWADESSTNLLFYLSRQLIDMPILLLATYRLHEAQAKQHPILDIHAEMQRYGLCNEVSLEFLSLQEITEYLSQRFPSANFDIAFIEWLDKVTSGNALFLKEYVELLIKDELLTLQGQLNIDWRQIHPPESVEAVIRSRIRYLDTDSREILNYASVEGEQFTTLLLERVLGQQRLSLLKKLRIIEHTHQIIYELKQQTKYQQPVTIYKFVHVLMHQTLYNELSKGEKVELSRVLLQIQSEIFKEADEVTRSQMLPQLINLAEIATEYEAKANYALQAAREAERTYAHIEALKHCQLGLNALDNLSSTANTEELRISLLSQQAFTYWWYIGDLSRAQDILHHAETIAQKLSKPELLVRVYSSIGSIYTQREEYDQTLKYLYKAADIAKTNQNELCSIYGQISNVYEYRGDFKQALEWSQKALSIAERIDNQTRLIWCYLDLGLLYGSNGEYEKGSKLYDKAITDAEKLGSKNVLRGVYNHTAYMRICARKDYDKALEWLQKAVEINKELGDTLNLAVNYHNIASIHRSRKDYEKAMELYQKVADIREKASDLRNLAITWHAMGSIKMNQDKLSEALALFMRSREMFERIGLLNNIDWVEESIKEVKNKLKELQTSS